MSYFPAGGAGLDAEVPAPPPGPGTAPPFAAPPSDRNKRSLWIGLVVGGLALVLCCAGGIFGVGIVIINSIEQTKREATATVQRYLDAVKAREWEEAHGELCGSLAARVSLVELADQEGRQPFTSYTLDEPEVTADIVEVQAHLSRSSGEVTRLFQLGTEGSANGGLLGICAIRSQ
jgi:hypothetical protein